MGLGKKIKFKLLFPITPNKNKQKSNKNLKAMMGATITQLPREVVKAMPFVKMKFNPLLEMGRQTCQWIREA
jgi:hypothetical protein